MEFIDVNCMLGKWGYGNLHFSNAVELSEEMKRLGINQALVFDSRSWLYDPKSGNYMLLTETVDYDNLIPVMVLTSLIDQEFGGRQYLYDFMMKNHIGAVRLFPNDHNYTLNPWNVDKLFSAAEEMCIPVFIEGRPVEGTTDAYYSQIYELSRVYKNTPIILLTTGYRSSRIICELMDKCPNFYIDTSTFINFRGIEDTVKNFGSERILFGSRMPFIEAGASLGRVIYADIKRQDKENIASRNIKRLLNNNKLFTPKKGVVLYEE
jgi:uncharacterized protein